jgi:predicted metalloprotease
MSSLMRPRLLAAAALLLALAGAWQYSESAKADRPNPSHQKRKPTQQQVRAASTRARSRARVLSASPSAGGSHDLILGSKDSAQPKNMEQFLTAVTKDVDGYWTKVFKDSGLPEPKVSYKWIPSGQTAASACGDADGTLGDSAAAYCPGDDTIYISEKFATDIYNGTLDKVLPGSSQGYGRTVGDFSVAYIVAHEYGHEVQSELGLFDEYGQQLPTMAFELQADCYAGTWAKSAYQENRLEDGDVQEALDATLAVGDFDTADPGHHGTPEQREEAWNGGFESGDPSSCSQYLDPAGADDGGTASQQPDPGAGSPQDQTPVDPQDQTPVDPQQQTPVDPQDQTPVDPQDQTPVDPQDDPGSSPYGVAASRRPTPVAVT